MKKRALLSVSDKTGIVEFAKELAGFGYQIISTGGTAAALQKAGLSVLGISEVTNFPEILDGRVKTLHPAVHAGLLARRDWPDHIQKMHDLGLNFIDLVAVNLYPFAATIKSGADFETAIENIDIGGPSMVRSAAKNAAAVYVVCDPADYSAVIADIKKNALADGDCNIGMENYLNKGGGCGKSGGSSSISDSRSGNSSDCGGTDNKNKANNYSKSGDCGKANTCGGGKSGDCGSVGGNGSGKAGECGTGSGRFDFVQSTPSQFRLSLMAKAYAHTAEYDTMIANYLSQKLTDGQAVGGQFNCINGVCSFKSTKQNSLNKSQFDNKLTINLNKVQDLRYGENPHQQAALYAFDGVDFSDFEKLSGKEMSYQNIADAFAAVAIVQEFDRPAVAAIKHATPCGVALADTISSAYLKTFECDPVSIFGGVIALNKEVDEATASQMSKTFLEIIIAPSFSDEAIKILTKKPDLRLVKYPAAAFAQEPAIDFKAVQGGLLAQNTDSGDLYRKEELKFLTQKRPTNQQLSELDFALTVAKHAKSNAIVISQNFAAIGIAGGQTSRVWATEQAIERAGNFAKSAMERAEKLANMTDDGLGSLGKSASGKSESLAKSVCEINTGFNKSSNKKAEKLVDCTIQSAKSFDRQGGEDAGMAAPLVAASDGFFPFDDCINLLAKAFVKAIIQPGGSIRDADSVAACDKHGIAMVTTGSRHFKH